MSETLIKNCIVEQIYVEYRRFGALGPDMEPTAIFMSQPTYSELRFSAAAQSALRCFNDHTTIFGMRIYQVRDIPYGKFCLSRMLEMELRAEPT